MDISVVKNAVGSLDKLLSQAKEALWDVEREEFDNPGYGDRGYYPRVAMTACLEELHDVLLVVLEAAEMPETRASLIKAWRGFIKGKGLGHTNDDEERENCYSPALTFLERLIKGLRTSVSQAISSKEAWTLSRLEGMLRDTAGLVRRSAAATVRNDGVSTPSVRISDLRQVCGVLVDGVAEVFGQPARVALAVGRKHKPTNAHVEGIRAARERAAFDANGDHCAHM